jgi:hypothetical protein
MFDLQSLYLHRSFSRWSSAAKISPLQINLGRIGFSVRVFCLWGRSRISKKIKAIVEKGIMLEHELLGQIEQPHKIAVGIVIAEVNFKDHRGVVEELQLDHLLGYEGLFGGMQMRVVCG